MLTTHNFSARSWKSGLRDFTDNNSSSAFYGLTHRFGNKEIFKLKWLSIYAHNFTDQKRKTDRAMSISIGHCMKG